MRTSFKDTVWDQRSKQQISEMKIENLYFKKQKKRTKVHWAQYPISW